ncbi:hypothetical protein CES85_4011 [Ochrobactrum quorumnocens]|uniref:Uncharacterized protein n=1 Tax=Ochrobactrum quorumnocens TaxID=271865 RepID=A0A248U9H6_9HYPH|nr:hypothetical protein CES85_4011 [[Ochrobactrum] quorumnocens]
MAAPATVSGLPFILVTPQKRHATESLKNGSGRQMNSEYPQARRPAV